LFFVSLKTLTNRNVNELYKCSIIRVDSRQISWRKTYAISNHKQSANQMKPAHYSKVVEARLTEFFMGKYPQVENVENGAANPNKRE